MTYTNNYPSRDPEYRIDMNPVLDIGKGLMYMEFLNYIYESTQKSNYYEVVNGAYDKR